MREPRIGRGLRVQRIKQQIVQIAHAKLLQPCLIGRIECCGVLARLHPTLLPRDRLRRFTRIFRAKLSQQRYPLAISNERLCRQKRFAYGMERTDGHACNRTRASEPCFQSCPHLGCRLIGKGHGSDPLCRHAARLQKICRARDQRFRFACAWASDHRERTRSACHRCILLGIECFLRHLGGVLCICCGFLFGFLWLLRHGLPLALAHGFRHSKQRRLPAKLFAFRVVEQDHAAKLSVIPRDALYTPLAKPHHALCNKRTRHMFNGLPRHLAQNPELRSDRIQKGFKALPHRLACGRRAECRRNHFGQRHDALERLCAPSGLSASSNTRCCTPTVSLFPHTGQSPPSRSASAGVRRTPQLRCPSK